MIEVWPGFDKTKLIRIPTNLNKVRSRQNLIFLRNIALRIVWVWLSIFLSLYSSTLALFDELREINSNDCCLSSDVDPRKVTNRRPTIWGDEEESWVNLLAELVALDELSKLSFDELEFKSDIVWVSNNWLVLWCKMPFWFTWSLSFVVEDF